MSNIENKDFWEVSAEDFDNLFEYFKWVYRDCAKVISVVESCYLVIVKLRYDEFYGDGISYALWTETEYGKECNPIFCDVADFEVIDPIKAFFISCVSRICDLRSPHVSPICMYLYDENGFKDFPITQNNKSTLDVLFDKFEGAE